MPRVHKHVARKDIYQIGIKIEDPKTKSGYRRDRSKPADENDKIKIAKGQSYWSWGLMVGGRGVQYTSLTPPKRSQLTNSDFLGQIYDLEDDLDFSGCSDMDELSAARDEIAEALRNLGQEQQDKYDNMPDGLQQGDTGQMIEERAQACESIADEFDQIDLDDYDEDLDDDELESLKDDVRELEVMEEGALVADDHPKFVELVEAKKQEKLDEWLDEKREELSGVGFDF